MKTKVRSSNIEICRIVSMMMIIMHHCVLHGGGIFMDPCINKIIAFLYMPGGKVGFFCFIAISCWFLVDSEFKFERFVKLWLEVVFYSMLTIIIAIILGMEFTTTNILTGLLPLTGAVQGFPAVYLAFYMITPVLYIVSKNITHKQNIYIVICFSIFVIATRYMAIFGTEQNVYSRLTLFIFCYFLMMLLKRTKIKFLENTFLMFFIFAITWMSEFGYYYYSNIYPEKTYWAYLTPLFYDEGSLITMICGLSLFMFFKNLKLNNHKVVNILGGTTLAILMLHDGHYTRNLTWQMLKTTEWFYGRFYFLQVIACAGGIYVIGTCIDLLRKYLLEKPLFSNRYVKEKFVKMDEWLKGKE